MHHGGWVLMAGVTIGVLGAGCVGAPEDSEEGDVGVDRSELTRYGIGGIVVYPGGSGTPTQLDLDGYNACVAGETDGEGDRLGGCNGEIGCVVFVQCLATQGKADCATKYLGAVQVNYNCAES